MAEDGELYVHLVGGSSDEEDEEYSHENHEEGHEEQGEIHEDLEEGETTFRAREDAEDTTTATGLREERQAEEFRKVPDESGEPAGRLRSGTESSGRGQLPDTRPSKRRRKWEDGPFVKITHGNLTRPALQRLQDLLRTWSASEDAVLQPWRTGSSSLKGFGGEELLSGTSVFLPGPRANEEAGLHGEGSEKMPWWIELPLEEEPSAPLSSATPAQKKTPKGLVRQLAVSSDVPAYDRGASTALTGSATLARAAVSGDAEEEGTLLASATPSSRAGELSNDRCFNCSSYTHTLRQCPKPRDAAAISAARSEHSANRNASDGNPGAPRRYHGLSRADYLLQRFGEPQPGILSAKLRNALGIGELDPPPWLERMRVFGYPPGYLKSKNRPSEEEEDAANVLPMFGSFGEEVPADSQQAGPGEENGTGEARNWDGSNGRAAKVGRVMGMFAATVGARQAAEGAAAKGETAEGKAEPTEEGGSRPAEAGANEGAAGSGAGPSQATVGEESTGGAVLALSDEDGALEDGEIEGEGGETATEGAGEGNGESLEGRKDDPLVETEEAYEEFEQTVKYPGLNAPIPVGACPRKWGVSEEGVGSREQTRRSRSEARLRVPTRRNSTYQPVVSAAWPALSSFLPLQFWSHPYGSHLLASAVLSPQRLTHRYNASSVRSSSPIQYGSSSPNRQLEDMDMSD